MNDQLSSNIESIIINKQPDVIAEFIDELKNDRSWYRRRRHQLQIAYFFLSISGIIFGVVVTVLIALGLPQQDDIGQRILMVSLSALASLCGTLVAQFRLRENWQLRELGRIDIDDLIIKAKYLSANSESELREKLLKLEMRRIAIARSQTSSFFRNITPQSHENFAEKKS